MKARLQVEKRHIVKTTFTVLRSRSLRIALALLVPCVLGFGLFRVNLARRRAYVPLLNISVAPFRPGLGQSIEAIAWSPDGKSLAGADNWNRWHVFDAGTGKVRREWNGGLPDSLIWSRDGKRLAGSYYGTVEVCDATTGALLRRITAVHDANLLEMYRGQHINCFVSPDGSLGAAVQWQDSITVWNLHSGQQMLRLKPFLRSDKLHTEACGLAFSSDASQMMVARILLDDEGIRAAKWDDPGAWRARGMEFSLYDLRTKRILRVFQSHSFNMNRRANIGLLFSPDAQTLAASDGESVQLWNVASGATGSAMTVSSAARYLGQQHLAFSPNGKFVARAGLNGEVEVWSVRSGQLLHTFHVRSSVSDVKFSPDGKRLATSGGTNTQGGFIKLWDTSFIKP